MKDMNFSSFILWLFEVNKKEIGVKKLQYYHKKLDWVQTTIDGPPAVLLDPGVEEKKEMHVYFWHSVCVHTLWTVYPLCCL